MDGYEVARRVRQQPDLARTVLVALTATRRPGIASALPTQTSIIIS
jgi:CheY-like chemotaxis protein